jgi:hypothetical protein
LTAFFDDMIGNDRLRERLGNDVRQDKLLHAYVLEGAEGFGKHTLALRIAAALACENKEIPNAPLPCRSCPACRKILSGNSPDVIYVTREEKHAALGVNPISKSRRLIAPSPVTKRITPRSPTLNSDNNLTIFLCSYFLTAVKFYIEKNNSVHILAYYTTQTAVCQLKINHG